MTRFANAPAATLRVGEVVTALIRPLAVDEAERQIAALTGRREAVLFASARGALTAAIRALAPAERAHVAIPAYTCVAVANAVRSAGGEISFVDVDKRGLVPSDSWPANIDVAVTQDTYGFDAGPAPRAESVRDASHRADLLTAGGAVIVVTSLEQSKSLSAGQGGIAVTDDPELAHRIRAVRNAADGGRGRIRHGLVTLLIVAFGRALWRGARVRRSLCYELGRRVAPTRLAGQQTGELAGRGVPAALRGAPNRTVARLAVYQLARIDEIAKRRRELVARYDRAAGVERDPEPLVRYPLAVADPALFEAAFRAVGWDLTGRWFSAPLHPAGSDATAFGLEPGAAPAAERLAATTVNLPTHPLVSDAEADELIAFALAHGARPLT